MKFINNENDFKELCAYLTSTNGWQHLSGHKKGFNLSGKTVLEIINGAVATLKDLNNDYVTCIKIDNSNQPRTIEIYLDGLVWHNFQTTSIM